MKMYLVKKAAITSNDPLAVEAIDYTVERLNLLIEIFSERGDHIALGRIGPPWRNITDEFQNGNSTLGEFLATVGDSTSIGIVLKDEANEVFTTLQELSVSGMGAGDFEEDYKRRLYPLQYFAYLIRENVPFHDSKLVEFGSKVRAMLIEIRGMLLHLRDIADSNDEALITFDDPLGLEELIQ